MSRTETNRRRAARPSPAAVIAMLALFVGLSGTAWALQKGEVRSKHIAKNAVKSKHVKDGGLTGQDIRDDSLTGRQIDESTLDIQGTQGLQGETGATGPAGPAGSPDAPQQMLDKLKTVDGSGSGLDSDLLDGLQASAFWALGGNAGTNPATDFLGTTDNQALELRVNDARALRLQPAADAGGNPYPNLIGGSPLNSVGAGRIGATIAGGGPSNPANPATANRVTGSFGTVGGGLNNASGDAATVGGGRDNTASEYLATVGGGTQNAASANNATVGGGAVNTASGLWATVGGGAANTASGLYATAPGGFNNVAAGDYSLVAGREAVNDATHDGVFMFADSIGATFNSAAANEFAVRASGGFRFRTNASLSTGCNLPAGSGTFACTSDREAKDAFAAVSPREVLDQLSRLPIESWVYKEDPSGVRHIGPTAQAFKRAFEIGADPTTISTVDADGVALAAIKGLNRKLVARNQRLRERLRDQGNRHSERIAGLEVRLAALERRGR